MALTTAQIQNAYVAFFNRPADVAGLNYWSSYTGSLAELYATFAQQTEYTNTFTGMNNTAKVNAVYSNLLGRTPDIEGLNYWVLQLDQGNVTLANLALAIVNGAQGTDATTVANKVSAATAYTNSLDTTAEIVNYANANATGIAAVKSWLAGVNSDAASLTAATAAAAINTLNTTVANNTTGSSDSTFTLTNGSDTATANVFTAGQVYSPGGNDRINSLQDEDNLTGTAGRTDNVLNLTLGNTNDNGSRTVTPTLNNIQTLNAVFSNTDGTGLDLQDATGLQALNITRISSALADGAVGSINAGAPAAPSVNLLNLPATTLSVDLSNSVAYSDVNVSYRNGELTGAETVTVNLNNAAIQDLVIGAQAIQTNHINNIVLNAATESHVQNMNIKGGATEVANQKLTINAASNFILGNDANANGNYMDDNFAFSTVAAPASNTVGANRLAEIEVTGAGNVTIGEVSARAGGMTLSGGTATGNITVNVTNAAGVAASAFTTGSGNDTVVSTGGLAADLTTADGNDTVTISGGVIAATSAVSLGNGNDTLTVGATVVQNGVNVLNQNIAGTVAGGASVNFGAGDNTLNLGDVGNVSIGEEAVVTFGDGNNTVTLSGSITGDTGGLDADTLGGELNFGAGNNTVTFDLTGQGNQATLVGGLLTAGAGTNVLNVTGNASVVAGAGLVAASAADADRVTGFQTLNLVSEQSIDALGGVGVTLLESINAINPAFQVTQNDNDAATADYTVDVSEFTGLTTINLENQAGIINATPEESLVSNRFVGDAAIYTLNNVAGTETITLTTVEAGTGIQARTVGTATLAQIAADTTADATLNLSLALNAAGNAAAVTLAGAGDVAINDTGVWSVVPVVADTHKEIQDLTLTINGADSRSVILTAGAGAAGDFRNSLTVNGDTTGTITFTGVEATTFTSSIAGNVNATFTAAENHNITTGAGNDVINLILDAANGSDTINLGNGTDRIIVNDDLRGNTGADADEYFNGWTSIEEVELMGGGAAAEFTGAGNVAGTMEVTLDDDAQTTGVNRVILSKDAFGANAVVDLDIGVDFERALTIDLAEGSTINIDNDADVNLTINVDARTTPVVAGGAPGTATIALADAGAGTVAFSIRVDDVGQTIGQAGTNVVITNADATAEIDSITLLDSNTVSATNVAPAGNQLVASEDQTGVISLTTHSSWAQAGDTLRIDASDINDDDRTDGGVLTDTDDQAVTINAGGAGIAYAVNVTGSQVQDTITGTAQADTIDGQAGNDTITGGVGADTLTGGAGVDTFVYTAVGDSRGVSGVDTITDFVTGTDKLQIAVTLAGAATTANLGRFHNTAATVGSGLVELDGAVGTEIIDAGYSTDGTYFIDLDGDGNINNTTDLRINVGTVNAGDINYVVTGTGGNDVIRGGQGADQIDGNGGADTYVMVGTISAAQANAYLAAETAVPGSVIPAGAVASVLDISELTTVRTQSEINTGDTLNATTGNNAAATLHVYGTMNLALINNGGALNVGTLVVHSNVILTVAQLNALGAAGGAGLQLDGDTPHTLTITRADGTSLSDADIVAVLNGNDYDVDGDGNVDGGSGAALTPPAITVTNSGPNTTVQLGTAAAVSTATFVNTTVPAATVDSPTITSAMSADDIATTLQNAAVGTATVVITGMTNEQINALFAASNEDGIANDGITGTASLSVAQFGGIAAAKFAAGATITLVDEAAAGGFVAAALNAKVDSVNVEADGQLTVTSLADALNLGNKLVDADDTLLLAAAASTIEAYDADDIADLIDAQVAVIRATDATALSLTASVVAALGDDIALEDSGNNILNTLTITGSDAELSALLDSVGEVTNVAALATAVVLEVADNTLSVTQAVAEGIRAAGNITVLATDSLAVSAATGTVANYAGLISGSVTVTGAADAALSVALATVAEAELTSIDALGTGNITLSGATGSINAAIAKLGVVDGSIVITGTGTTAIEVSSASLADVSTLTAATNQNVVLTSDSVTSTLNDEVTKLVVSGTGVIDVELTAAAATGIRNLAAFGDDIGAVDGSAVLDANVDLTILTAAGDQTITGGAGDDTITAGAGDDTIVLSSGGVDKVVFGATAVANGEDTITHFTAGNVGDVLDFSAFVTGGTATAAAYELVGLDAAQAVTDNDLAVVYGTGFAAGNIGSAAGQLNIANDASAVVLLGATATATSAQIYYVVDTESGAGQTWEITLVGTVSFNTTDLSNLHANNFDITA